ncbi:MAG: peptidase S11 [Sulfurimonas sp. RIFOXYD12_FULL_33_39]|uniref:D-alanyl-D-alanine carboxypeptidase family protein n=1 Tax=unclassified Sulfurimonas TaxID=2623549 RepID=UPI0008CD111F|nr:MULTISPECIES: serine hydrolase [unclassified Sulfurimonas]OHE05360.1 MAG: peptidase S11 [Sulfurimonas sp. RIFCSPLOWO2_12_FULL_34_6]OHE09833.1 MAG: peptidase S11 [Sulfurimonas sp. RIFOXYD12_FULL_33_39]OHE13659.1 MAG: peptidase S11 [Sulfurimonas sp. RIFOXYD2_FULL_34_21]
MIKKIFVLSLALSVSLFGAIDKHKLDKLKIGAMIVKDLNTKNVLYSKYAEKRLSPASLTKVMTVLLAIQSDKMNKSVTITRDMLKVEPTIAGYKVGDVVLMSDLVKAAMIKSDNDAAKAIAIAIGGGDEKKFINMMNAKAKQLGMKHTHFSNPCGFDAKNHYSSPNDLVKMAEYAIKNPIFNKISNQSTHDYRVLRNGQYKTFKAYTHNHLLNKYEYAVGVKTGYTSKAGACLIARAKKGRQDCLIVMMNSKEDRWEIAKKIFQQVI